MSVSSTSHHLFKVVSDLRFPPISLAIAYGSGVFKQKHEVKPGAPPPLLDYIFVVDDALEWHKQNLTENGDHYAPIFRQIAKTNTSAAARGVKRVQDISAKAYFNTLVPWQDKQIKYGVVSKEAFIDDLTQWQSLYFAGRLQKPVLLHANTGVQQAGEGGDSKMWWSEPIQSNRRMALALAALWHDTTPSLREVFYRISSISYLGDFRMQLGENPKKAMNIVDGQYEHFLPIYSQLVDELGIKEGKQVGKDDRVELLSLLPTSLSSQLGSRAWELSEEKRREALNQAIRNMTFWVHLGQSAKGLVTAGWKKSFVYVRQKLSRAK
mmetsp:Transcript_45393/g.117526  ORF Transcript_45393/g.117526 Transcript_45393/m.117526 type:complete len:324 (-) Transcript_45393:146-1117(-)